ncbi:hypothetical protein N7444_006226 [Penicillium canescens]|nr:hypothetical protein N7444_006226 [Penicillium canescens]
MPRALISASFFLYTLANASFVLFPKSSVENAGYSDECVDALSTNITQCNNAVSSFDPNTAYSQKILALGCTDKCGSALVSWEKSIKDSCRGVTYVDGYGNNVPISSVASIRSFNFNQTCRLNEGEFCNTVLGNLTVTPSNSSAANACNECALFKLRDTAQFQYNDGPLVYSKGIYQSYTSSCLFTGYPLTVTPTTTPMSPPATSSTGRPRPTGSRSSSAPANTPTWTCSGTKYNIKSDDTCNSISLSQDVATWQLLMDNNLPAYCAKFPKKGSLCIKNKCNVYTVRSDDTCSSVSTAHNISTVQLRAWNPWIDTGCYNFNRTIGTQICVDEPGQKYVPPATATTSTGSSSGANSAVPVPSNAAANTTIRCGEYYVVQPGEECDIFTTKFGISLQDFEVLNPEINSNCTNLLSNTSYCVQPVGDINSYPNAPGYRGPDPSVSKVPFTSVPDSTYAPIFVKLPLAPRTREGCLTYADGSTLQYNMTGASDCKVAAYFFETTEADLKKWNPSLGKGSGSSNSTDYCSFSKQYRYCMDYEVASSTAAPSTTPTSTPVPAATKHARSHIREHAHKH